jgi:SAM-dependent methyltransferase
MNIPWRLKSFAFSMIDRLHADALLYFLQKHVTKRAKINLTAILNDAKMHEAALSHLKSPRIIEFGAGKHLAQNIYLSRIASEQIVIDLNEMLDFELLNQAIQKTNEIIPNPPLSLCYNLNDLHKHYRVSYRAPFDAANTQLATDSVDACITTNTLEHIPLADLRNIFREMRRILRPDGLVSLIIDYSDHYSHTDKTIGRLNYLQFSEQEFRTHNHKNHFQNRLRHQDYSLLFTQLGFSLIAEQALMPCPLPLRVDAMFDVSIPTTTATRGVFLLRNTK